MMIFIVVIGSHFCFGDEVPTFKVLTKILEGEFGDEISLFKEIRVEFEGEKITFEQLQNIFIERDYYNLIDESALYEFDDRAILHFHSFFNDEVNDIVEYFYQFQDVGETEITFWGTDDVIEVICKERQEKFVEFFHEVLRMDAGETEVLTLSGYDKDTVKGTFDSSEVNISSSDSEVALIKYSEGEFYVEALKRGEAEITVKYGESSDTLKVNVIKDLVKKPNYELIQLVGNVVALLFIFVLVYMALLHVGFKRGVGSLNIIKNIKCLIKPNEREGGPKKSIYELVKKKYKVILVLFLIVFYLLFTFYFGVKYWIKANESQGSEFIFQEDIKKQLHLEKFLEYCEINKNSKAYYDSKDLIDTFITNFDWNNLEVERVDTSGRKYNDADYFIRGHGIVKPKIASQWGEFYKNFYEEQGYEVFRVVSIKYDSIGSYDVFIQIFNVDGNVEEYEDYEKISENQYKIENLFFTIELDDEFDGNIDAYLEHVLPPTGSSTEALLKAENDDLLYPLHYMTSILYSADSFPDDKAYVLQNIVSGDVQYRLLDFVYFSMVTATTLGYGDILPNSSEIRSLVMTETFLGLILMGAIVAFAFSEYKTTLEDSILKKTRVRQEKEK